MKLFVVSIINISSEEFVQNIIDNYGTDEEDAFLHFHKTKSEAESFLEKCEMEQKDLKSHSRFPRGVKLKIYEISIAVAE